MMRSDALNLHVYPVRMEITSTQHIPTSHVCSTYKRKLKEFLVYEALSQIYSTYKYESKGIIVNKCSTEEDESECVYKNINKQKEESSFTDEVPSYFNIFECCRDILNRLDMTYERACMATPK